MRRESANEPRNAGYSVILYPCTFSSYGSSSSSLRLIPVSKPARLNAPACSLCVSTESLLEADVDEHDVSVSVTC